MPKTTKRRGKTPKRRSPKRSKTVKRGYKKMKGGIGFNPVFSTDQLPNDRYYDLNKYVPDLQRSPEVVDSRLLPNMIGGKTRKRRRNKYRKRKMRGGSLIGTDLATGINTTNTNDVFAFGSSGGTKFMYDTINAKPIDNGPHMSYITNVEPNLV